MELSGLELSSLSISKGSVYEEMTMTQAAMEDALSRHEDTISNERIQKGDRILDTYTVQDEAISGGMGSVWRVHHENWNTDLAMKRPQPKFFVEGSQRRKAEFIAGCENWINLGLHPNIVSCYYVREIGGVPTIFSEWMDNGSLKDRIRDGSLYQGTEAEVQERILDIAIQTARGLAYSHEKGLIHQDIKPGNILLSKNWDAKIADFGLAKARSQMESGSMLLTGYTLEYCPKEQADGAAPEAWMDIYAWALTVLEMYCGKRIWAVGAEAKLPDYDGAEKYSAHVSKKVHDILTDCLRGKQGKFSNAGLLLSEIESSYTDLLGKSYRRAAVNMELAAADNLNNHAISMLDLRKEAEAAVLWERALAISPSHYHSTINYSMYQWHHRKLEDLDVLKIFSALPEGTVKSTAISDLKQEPFGVDELVRLPCSEYLDGCFTPDGLVWLARGESGLAGYSCKTGEELVHLSGEAAAVCAEPTGRYIFSARSDSYLHTRVQRISLVDGYPSQELTMPLGRGKDNDNKPEGPAYCLWGTKRSRSVHQIWTEDCGKILCIQEEHLQRTQYDVDFSVFTISRFELTECGEALFISIGYTQTPEGSALEAESKTVPNWEVSYRRKIYHGIDNSSAEIGRVNWDSCEYPYGKIICKGQYGWVKSLSFMPQAVAQDTGLVLCSGGILCRPYGQESQFRYQISQYVDVEQAIEREKYANDQVLGFQEAMRSGDNAKAIEFFNHYRDIPGKADEAACIEMERRLSETCTRIGVHHFVKTDRSGFAPFESTFKYHLIEPRYVSGGWLPDVVFKTYKKAIKSIFPIVFTDRDGQKHKLKRTGNLIWYSNGCFFVLLDQANAIARVDLPSGKMQPAIMIDSLEKIKGRDCLLAPDGRTWAIRMQNGFRIFQDGIEIRTIPMTSDSVSFTPDSRFLCGKEIVCIYADGAEISLPSELAENGVFSKDGFLYAHKIVDYCIRISYNYSVH